MFRRIAAWFIPVYVFGMAAYFPHLPRVQKFSPMGLANCPPSTRWSYKKYPSIFNVRTQVKVYFHSFVTYNYLSGIRRPPCSISSRISSSACQGPACWPRPARPVSGEQSWPGWSTWPCSSATSGMPNAAADVALGCVEQLWSCWLDIFRVWNLNEFYCFKNIL